jgi:hypothetical protein
MCDSWSKGEPLTPTEPDVRAETRFLSTLPGISLAEFLGPGGPILLRAGQNVQMGLGFLRPFDK